MTERMKCLLCKDGEWHEDIINHLRLMHPDSYDDGPDHWADGDVVIVDETLEPDDFKEDGDG